jgi:hypothetical protein
VGMGGGGQSQTTTEHKEIKLPPWVEQASEENYGFAKQIADRPYQAYGGPTVAGFDPYVGEARRTARTLDDYQPYYKNAEQALQQVAGYNPTNYNPSTVAATMLPSMDRAAYLNPNTAYVEANAIENAKRAGLAAQTGLAAKATKSGGMGGSRDAVQRAVQGAETTRGIGDLSAELRSKAYDSATQAMMSDAARKQQAETQTGTWRQEALSEYEKNKLAAGQARVAAAHGMTETADAAQQARLNEIATKLGIGNMYQQQQQRMLDDRARKWLERYNYPLTQLNIRLAALGMSPYGHTEDGTSTTTSKGGGGGGAGQAMGFAGQFMQMLPMLAASDESLKTNIEKLDDSGPVPIYAYDYKADVKAAKKGRRALPPKRVGPMANDIEKIAPHLVKRIGGKRVIDLSSLQI